MTGAAARIRSIRSHRPLITIALLGAFGVLACGGGSSGGGEGGSGGSSTGTGGSTGIGGSATGGGAGGSATGGGAGGSATGGGSGGSATGGAAGGKGGGGGSGQGGATGGAAGGSAAGASGAAGRGSGGGGGGAGGGSVNCTGHALSLSANGTNSDSDTALARVEIDLKTDLPIGNAKRTIEYWAYIKTTDWVGDKNEMYYYGGTASAGAFGMDFGTNTVTGMSSNHATLDPFTNGGFNDDSTNNLGINSSSDQWVHIATVWDGTNLITYVNGQAKITTAGTGGITALATAQSVLTVGCNPTNNQCFNGLFDELQVWNVARTATDIQSSYKKPLVGNETGLVGYWKFDEASGTTTADAVSAGSHTAHNGTLKADTTAHDPTFVTPPVPLPLVCN